MYSLVSIGPKTVQHDRPTHNAQVRCIRALPSTSWGGGTSGRDDGPRPRVHALLHRATLPNTAGSSQPDRPDCRGTSLAPFQVAIGPASGIISGPSPDFPQGGHARVCGGVRLRLE